MRCALPRNCAPSCAGASARRTRASASNSMSVDFIRVRFPREEGATIAVLAAAALGGVALSLWAAPGAPGYLGAGLALSMLAIAAIDARAFIIPNELTVAGVLLGLLNA